MPGRIDTAWRGLEEVEGLSSTKRHWALACGAALFKVIDLFLVPTGERAEWIPDPTDPLRQMRVIPAIRRQGCDFLGVSEDEPRSPNVSLSALDLAVYRLDLSRFGREIAAAMGLLPSRPLELISPNTARLTTQQIHGLDLFLVLPCREDDLLVAADLVRIRSRGEFALVTPTKHTVVPRARAAIDNGAFQHTTLFDLLSVSNDGLLSPIADWRQLLRPADNMRCETRLGYEVTNEDLSLQIASGIESIRTERISEEVKNRAILVQLNEMAGGADEFLVKIIAGFGADENMARLFMLLRSDSPKKPGKHLTYEEIGAQLGVKKQAITKQVAKMEEKYPAAHRYIKSIRSPSKMSNYSEISPSERRKIGIEESYNYDQS